MLTTVLLSACQKSDEFLSLTNPNTITPETYWVSEENANKWIMSIYSALAYTDQGAQQNFGRFFAWASMMRSDEYYTNFANIWGMQNAHFQMDGTNLLVDAIWNSLYKAVFRANVAIRELPNMTNISETARKHYLGEAEFLRGFSYFYLVNLWERVPLVTVPAESEADYFPFQADPADVWQQVITDFAQAKAKLPVSWDAANLGRATRGAATGHLGKAHLFLKHWDEAEKEFDEIIQSQVYDLTDNYNDNCNDQHENNIESLFEFQFNDLLGQNFSTWRSRDAGPRAFAGDLGEVEPWLLAEFLKESTVDGDIDPRAYATLIFNDPNSTLYGGVTYQQAYGPTFNKIYWRKYRNVDTKPNDLSGFQSGINIRMMRFADVLLMHAEAENEERGPTPEALASINRVRERASMAPLAITDKDELRTAIRRERVLELSGEENRWLDLLRWDMLAERFASPEVMSGDLFIVGQHEYYPIPTSEIYTNPNLDQNPGYQ